MDTSGITFNLTCTSSGSPPDTFTWMKDGIPVTQSTNVTTVIYNRTVAVFSSSYTIGISDNGTYTCTVINPIGSDSFNFNSIRKLYMYVRIIKKIKFKRYVGSEATKSKRTRMRVHSGMK